jgi:hypothetical protein
MNESPTEAASKREDQPDRKRDIGDADHDYAEFEQPFHAAPFQFRSGRK